MSYLHNCLVIVKVSMIARVASIALGDLRIVANMYKPFSVKAFGKEVECFKLLNRWKFSTSCVFSSAISSKIYPSGNFLGLFFTALFTSLVSTPYSTATSLSSNTQYIFNPQDFQQIIISSPINFFIVIALFFVSFCRL